MFPQALLSGSGATGSAEQAAEAAEHAFTLCYDLGAQLLAATSAAGSSLPADVDAASAEGHLLALCLEHGRLGAAAGATSAAAAEKLLAAGSRRRGRRAAASDEAADGFDMNQAAVEEVALVQVGGCLGGGVCGWREGASNMGPLMCIAVLAARWFLLTSQALYNCLDPLLLPQLHVYTALNAHVPWLVMPCV
jgi:hypothetical protein